MLHTPWPLTHHPITYHRAGAAGWAAPVLAKRSSGVLPDLGLSGIFRTSRSMAEVFLPILRDLRSVRGDFGSSHPHSVRRA